MEDVTAYGALIAAVALALTVAVLAGRLSGWLRIPAPAIFLIVAAIVSDVVPQLGEFSIRATQRGVTLALILILFDGGMHIGTKRFRAAARPVLVLGIAGTVLTAAAVAVLTHLLGFSWRAGLLLGAALSPTDPAVVFSVLGRREISGRSGTVLEGESGANDPVGIAIMVSLLVAGGASGGSGSGGSSLLDGLGEFAVQMAVGGAVGLVGGWALLRFMRHVTLPSEGLYSIRVLAGAGVLYGVATVAHGSGFLAVFLAGILLGDAGAPYKREIERFHGALASLAEIVAFILLGLTVSLRSMPAGYAWELGLIVAVVLTVIIRPLVVGPLLAPVRMRRGEKVFVLWSGLKGAVPILLGTYIVTSGTPDATRLYDIVVVVVAFSVLVQGGLVPAMARWCRVPMRVVEPEPWALGMRFREKPEGLRRFVVDAGSPADGVPLEELPLHEDVWISLVSRQGRLVRVGRDTVLRAGDEVLALVDPGCEDPGRPFRAATAASG